MKNFLLLLFVTTKNRYSNSVNPVCNIKTINDCYCWVSSAAVISLEYAQRWPPSSNLSSFQFLGFHGFFSLYGSFTDVLSRPLTAPRGNGFTVFVKCSRMTVYHVEEPAE